MIPNYFVNGLVEEENKVTFSLSAIIYIYYNSWTSEGLLQIVTYKLCKSNNCGIIIILTMTTWGALPIIEIAIITIKVKLITLHIFAIAFDFKQLFNLLTLQLISTISFDQAGEVNDSVSKINRQAFKTEKHLQMYIYFRQTA